MKIIEIYKFLFIFIYFKDDSFLQLYDISEGVWHMAGHSQNAPNIYVSYEFTREMRNFSELCLK